MTGPAPRPTLVSLRYPVDALVSFHYYRRDEHMVPLVQTGRLRMIGDSGAYSAWSVGAKINLGEYAGWCRRWWDHLCWCASLDVIGDPEATWRNWVTLRDRHELLTVPTLHAGADTSWLDAYAGEGVDLVGLGGMGRSVDAPRAFRWVVHMIRHARRRWEQVRFHLWGVTRRQFLDALPVWSADSSGTLGQGYRYGNVRVFDPTTGRDVRIDIRRGTGSRATYRHGELLRKVYGVDPAQIETSHPGNRTVLIQLAAASTQQYAEWLQRRHRVAAPSMFRTGPATGTLVHLTGEGSRRPPGEGDLDQVVDGPRVHLVSGGGRKQADHDDLAEVAGPRVHVAMATPGRAQADEAALIDPGDEGPRVHVVAGSQQAPGRNDLDALAGPRLHLVDGHPGNMQAITRRQDQQEGDEGS